MKIKQQGFTLVELIVVIVILGILAATALPRFINMSAEARVAAVNGIAGGLRSASALVYSKWQAAGGLASIDAVSMVGAANVTVNDSGFPTADDAGIVSAMGCTASPCQGITVTTGAGTSIWTPSGGGGTCNATYTALDGSVAANTGGCQ